MAVIQSFLPAIALGETPPGGGPPWVPCPGAAGRHDGAVWPGCAGGLGWTIPYTQPRLVADLVPRLPRSGEAADPVTRRTAAMGTDGPRSEIIPAGCTVRRAGAVYAARRGASNGRWP
jgi:hypothetical protein